MFQQQWCTPEAGAVRWADSRGPRECSGARAAGAGRRCWRETWANPAGRGTRPPAPPGGLAVMSSKTQGNALPGHHGKKVQDF